MEFVLNLRRVLNSASPAASNLHSYLASTRFYSTLTTPKLFISGLSRLTTDEKLREAFASFGQLLEAKVVTDRATGRSKGFGFVTYATIEEAQKAKDEMNGKFLDGWVIFADPAKPREPRPPPQPSSASPQQGFTTNKTVGWCG